MTSKCPKCLGEIPPNSEICSLCGQKLILDDQHNNHFMLENEPKNIPNNDDFSGIGGKYGLHIESKMFAGNLVGFIGTIYLIYNAANFFNLSMKLFNGFEIYLILVMIILPFVGAFICNNIFLNGNDAEKINKISMNRLNGTHMQLKFLMGNLVGLIGIICFWNYVLNFSGIYKIWYDEIGNGFILTIIITMIVVTHLCRNIFLNERDIQELIKAGKMRSYVTGMSSFPGIDKIARIILGNKRK